VSRSPKQTLQEFDFFKMHRKRAEIYSTEPRRDIDMRRWFDEGMKLVVQGMINTSEMVTHIYPLSRVQEAFDLRNDKSTGCNAIHVMIDCETASDEIVAVAPDHAAIVRPGGAAASAGSCCAHS